MSLNNDGQSCALCHAYLFPEDDVVYCPECGAPHHRECYNSIGKCALEELHGTENQYDKLKKAAEAKKQEETEKNQEGENTYETPFGAFSPIDFLGGVTPDEEIEEGITAKEAAKFVLSNTMRYIPKFKRLNKDKKTSWNFLASLFPCGWLLSRKMYLKGIVVGVLEIIATLLTAPLQITFYNLGITNTNVYTEMLERMMLNVDKIPQTFITVAFLGSAISVALSVFFGVWGDYVYKKHAINTIKEIKQSGKESNEEYRKKGGVNIYVFLIALVALRYIPAIIVSLIS